MESSHTIHLHPRVTCYNLNPKKILGKRPICAHVETKLSGQDLQNALTRLGIWFKAYFARLGELAVESDARPVTHPLDWEATQLP